MRCATSAFPPSMRHFDRCLRSRLVSGVRASRTCAVVCDSLESPEEVRRDRPTLRYEPSDAPPDSDQGESIGGMPSCLAARSCTPGETTSGPTSAQLGRPGDTSVQGLPKLGTERLSVYPIRAMLTTVFQTIAQHVRSGARSCQHRPNFGPTLT